MTATESKHNIFEYLQFDDVFTSPPQLIHDLVLFLCVLHHKNIRNFGVYIF